MKTYAEVMLHCTGVNARYILPAGFDAVARLYQRIASESLGCALAWRDQQPCPPHQPATSAFWHSVVAWADAFGRRLGLDEEEWYSKFVAPHRDFAWYLRPYQRGVQPPEDLLRKALTPDGPWLLELDARWTALVIKLTARWGVLHHLKDLRALWQALRLIKELRSADLHRPVARAYLKSDIQFFRELFKPLPFSDETRGKIDQFLARAEKDIDFAQWVATLP